MAKGRGVLRILLWMAGTVVVLLAVTYVGLVIGSNRMLAATVTVPAPVSDIRIPEGDPTAIARGTYLIDHVLNCKICHATDFGGRAEVDNAMVGRLWAPNLTAGEGSATRNYTAVDWVRSIRHGVAPDGHRLILMPSEEFQTFSDGDLGAIVAAVKAMPAVNRADEGIQLGPLGRALLVTGQVRFAFDSIKHAGTRADVPVAATLEWGNVLIGACRGCHGEGLSGGPIPGGDPNWPPAANLTTHETGLKTWTIQDFSRALRQGKRPDGTDVRLPMPWASYAGMTDADVEALFRAIQAAPPKPAGGR